MFTFAPFPLSLWISVYIILLCGWIISAKIWRAAGELHSLKLSTQFILNITSLNCIINFVQVRHIVLGFEKWKPNKNSGQKLERNIFWFRHQGI